VGAELLCARFGAYESSAVMAHGLGAPKTAAMALRGRPGESRPIFVLTVADAPWFETFREQTERLWDLSQPAVRFPFALRRAHVCYSVRLGFRAAPSARSDRRVRGVRRGAEGFLQ
jgi:hypothetical protein